MLGHHLVAALRNANRNRFYAAVCLVGLTVGMTSALLIILYVIDELSYDRWIPGHDRVVQLSMGLRGGPTLGAAPSDVGQWVERDFAELEGVTRLFREPVVISREDRRFAEVVTWADASFFEVLPLPVIAGNPSTALESPDSIVLTRDTALKLFGSTDVIGEAVELNFRSMSVSAVLENLPSNTHLDIDILAPAHAPFSTAAEQDRNPLEYFGSKAWLAVTYARLPPDLSIAEFRRAMPAMLDRRTAPGSPETVSARYDLSVRPIAHLHLSSRSPDDTGIDLGRVSTFAAVAVLIVVAASINFINLMTAQGARRAKEVGLRKFVGAKRRHLIAQFMIEAWLHVAIATALSLVLITAMLLPWLNAFLLRGMGLGVLLDPSVLSGLALFVLGVGLLAGAYPSLVLSRYPASTVLTAPVLRGGGIVRESLIVTQFAILITLLIGTASVHRQMSFAIGETLVSYTQPILTIATSCPAVLKTELAALSGVTAVACAGQLPQWGVGTARPIRIGDEEYRGGIYYTSVDHGYFEMFGLDPLAGRFFAEEIGTDTARPDNVWTAPEALVLNESAVRLLELGSPAQAVGRRLAWRRLFRLPSTLTPEHDVEIIGVVEDFQMGPVTDAGARPTAFYVDPGQASVLLAQLSGQELPPTLAAIDEVWEQVGDPRPIERSFFDERVHDMYLDIARQARIFGAFAAVALLIALLGLLGLLVHTVERRTKEIAVRKLLGAKPLDITALLLWQFAKPVAWSVLLALPVAYLATSAWLDGFARRIELDAASFAVPPAATLVIALAIVAVHAMATLRRHPVKALRHE